MLGTISIRLYKGNEPQIHDRLGRRVMIGEEAWWPGEYMQEGEAYNRGIDMRMRKEIKEFLNE